MLPSLHGGGAERAAVTLLNGLADRGCQATLFLFVREGAYLDQLGPAVRVITGRAGRVGRLQALRRYLAAEPQDVVASFLSHFTTYAAVRASGTSAKYVISQQTPVSAFLDDADYAWRAGWRRRAFTVVARTIYPRVDAIAATSQGVADDLAGSYGVPRSRLIVVPNPVDVDRVEREASEPLDQPFAADDVPTIVTAGRLAHAKNLPLLVDALATLAGRMAFRAWILGQGELAADLRARLTRAGLDDRVTLVGFQRNPWKFMARADVFLLTSRYEGFGNVLIEAMASGLPVVATASFGTRDIVEHERTGLLVDVHEPTAVAEALERVLGDRAFNRRLAAAARERARDFAVDAVVDRFEGLLDRVMAA